MIETYTARQTTGGISHVERNERALLMAISKIRWPGAKKDLLLYLLANDSGAALGTILPQVATSEETGMSASTARTYFAELVDERVLIRFDGAGTRGHAFRINWRFDEWRVPWLRSRALDDPRASAKREAALAHLAAILHPPADRKPGFVARPVARQEPTPARSGASLFGASDATSRATEPALAARTAARQAIAPNEPDTIPLIREPLSLPQEGRKQAETLLATIERQGGAPVVGKLAREVRQIAADAGEDVADLVGALHRAPLRMAIKAYIEILGQAVARRDLALDPPRPRVPVWEPADVAEPAPDPEFSLLQIRAAREELRSRGNGADACETEAGGGA